MNETSLRAQKIVRNPLSQRSQKRYKADMDNYHSLLIASQTSMESLTSSSSENMASDPVTVACAYILRRRGPKEHGYDALKASSTGGAIKSAAVSYWRERGLTGEYVPLPDGSYTGNQGKIPDLQSIINTLDKAQKISRCNLTQRAYQETHEDVRALYYRFVEPQLERAINLDITVDYMALQCACANIMKFNAVARGAEMICIGVRNLIFTSDNPNAPVVAVLPVAKTKRKNDTYFRFTKGIDISVCGLAALHGWLCVLRAHHLCDGNLFLQVTSNVLQGGTCLDGTTYGKSLRQLGNQCGISGLEARRGAVGYH